jgi:hypothetical protein
VRGRIEASSVDGRVVRDSHPARNLVAILCVLGLALAVTAPSASAVVVGHTFDFEFGGAGAEPGQFGFETFGNSDFSANFDMGIGIDHDTDAFYVADAYNRRIQKFDAEGNFLLTWGYGVQNGANELQTCHAPEPCQTGIFGPALGQLQHPTAVAVDNSGGPNDGAVYVADATSPAFHPSGLAAGRNQILKYGPEGQYLGVITGSASPGGVFKDLHFRGGISVDGNGFLWAADEIANNQGRMLRFSNQTNNAYVGGSEWMVQTPGTNGALSTKGIEAMAAAPTGSHVYINTNAALNNANTLSLNRFTANGSSSRAYVPAGNDFDSSIATEAGTGHVYLSNGANVQEYAIGDKAATPVGPPFGAGKLGNAFGLAVNPSTGTVYTGSPELDKVIAFKPRRVPAAITEAPTEVGHTSGTLNGITTPDPVEGGDVSECVFEWGLTTNYENSIPCDPGAPFSEQTSVSATLEGLQMESTYHYRIAATNSIDTNHGEDQAFTPRAVLELSTDEPEDVTSHSATIRASFDPAGDTTEYQFEWGKDPNNYQESTPINESGSEPGVISVSEEIEGLEDYTNYHYRIVATNSLGTSIGPDRSFRTDAPDLPVVSDTASSSVTDDGAELSAVVNPNFGETIYGFEFGETVAYENQVLGSDLLDATGEGQTVALDIGGLTPGTTYQFRAIAINFGGVSYGPNLSFTTLDAPKVLSTSSGDVDETGARLSALIHSGLTATDAWFEYGPTPAYGSSTPATAIGDGPVGVQVSAQLGNLAAGKTHHFRAVARNAIGIVRGPDQTFTTKAGATPPPPPTPPGCKRGFALRGGKCVRVCKRGFVRRGRKCVSKKKLRAKRRRAAKRKRQANVTRGALRGGE